MSQWAAMIKLFKKDRQLDISVQQRELADKRDKEAREREEAEARKKNLRRILFMQNKHFWGKVSKIEPLFFWK